MHPEFGADLLKKADPYYDYLIGIPEVLGPYKTDLLLKIRFEQIYGIRDHEVEVPDVPFPYAAIDPLMDYSAIDPKFDTMRRFADARVNEHFCSYKEWIQLPVDMAESILEAAEKIAQERFDMEKAAAEKLAAEQARQKQEALNLANNYRSNYSAGINNVNFRR